MPGISNPNIFANATAIRDSITKEQEKYIQELYKQWSNDILDQADYYFNKTTSSSYVSSMYYSMLYGQMQKQSQEVANSVYTNIKNGMFKVSDAVISDMVSWTSKFGFDKEKMEAAFAYVPQSIVNSLATGSVYGDSGSWSLSSAIWGDNEKTLRDIYSIVAGGVAEQMPIERMANLLAAYVNPNRSLMWTGPGNLKIYKKAVDYNAQRLARTLVQHTYQQSFVAATKDNPFITEYIWLANGSRVCPLCADRDGTHYKKNELPLDHPNGMCTMEPVVDENMIDKLADWVNSPDGTYPEIDEFASNFGYDVSKMPQLTLAQIKQQYGNSNYKYAKSWLNHLPKDVQQTVYQMQRASGKNLNQWYQQEIMSKTTKQITHQATQVTKQMINNDKKLVLDTISRKMKTKAVGATKDDFEFITNRLSKFISDSSKDGIKETLRKLKNFRNKEEGSFFKGSEKIINIDMKGCSKQAAEYKITGNARYSTFFHEFGHAYDRLARAGSGTISSTKPFIDALKKDLKRIGKMNDDDIFDWLEDINVKGTTRDIIESYQQKYYTKGASDFLSAVRAIDEYVPELKGKLSESSKYYIDTNIVFGHSKDYYLRRGINERIIYDETASELFANVFQVVVCDEDGKMLKAMKEVAPNSVEFVEKLLKQ